MKKGPALHVQAAHHSKTKPAVAVAVLDLFNRVRWMLVFRTQQLRIELNGGARATPALFVRVGSDFLRVDSDEGRVLIKRGEGRVWGRGGWEGVRTEQSS